MVIEDILNYIRKTPHNSNVNVIKGMLENIINKSDEGGSASQNYLQIIRGTLNNPFGEVDLQMLADQIQRDNATAKLYTTFRYTPQEGNPIDYEFMGYIKVNGRIITFESCNIFRTDLTEVMYAVWFDSGTFEEAAIKDFEGKSLFSMANQIETELTICWHPLPPTQK